MDTISFLPEIIPLGRDNGAFNAIHYQGAATLKPSPLSAHKTLRKQTTVGDRHYSVAGCNGEH